MSSDSQRIVIDHEILTRSATALHRTAESLAAVSETIAGAHISGNAFGAMNAWMIAPVHAVSSNSFEHIRVSGNVVKAVAAATDAAANDFESTEGDVLQWITELDEQLAAGLARPAPPAGVAAPHPVPSPSPNAAPTPEPTP